MKVLCLFLILLCGCVPKRQENRYLLLEQVQPKVKKPLIMIDPGHGGKDEGAKENPCEEKNLTLKTARYLQEHLRSMGYRTVLTRERDIFVGLDERCALANELDCTLFVSVHFNHAPSKEAHGLEVYYYEDEENEWRAKHSKALAEQVQKKIIHMTNITSRGIKTADYRVIRKTQMPAVLVEGGFLSNEEECKLCNDPLYQNALALGIARGIDDFMKQGRRPETMLHPIGSYPVRP